MERELNKLFNDTNYEQSNLNCKTFFEEFRCIENYGSKKKGPKAFGNAIPLQASTYAHLLKCPMMLDLAYEITKSNIQGTRLPSWMGFNQLLSLADVPPKSVIGYRPTIDASSTKMDTVLTILQRSVKTADKSGLEAVIFVMDQSPGHLLKGTKVGQEPAYEETCLATWSISYHHVRSWLHWRMIQRCRSTGHT